MKEIQTVVTQRREILRLLYSERMEEKSLVKGVIREVEIRNTLGDCNFNLGVLEELGQIERIAGTVRITGNGVVAFEEKENTCH
jgi:hypothetical protein